MYLDRFLIARGRNLKQILKMLYTTGSKLPVADPGGVARGTRLPPLFLDQTEARRAEKFFLETAPPSPPPYLKVWIRHWLLPVFTDIGTDRTRTPGQDFTETRNEERERTREAREQKVI